MYSPDHYKYSDQNLIREVIEKNPFATLVSPDLTISHLPIYLHGNKLIGHMARANSHWQVASNKLVKVIFHGPHAYVSPIWYTESLKNVPTWNYVSVHVEGRLQCVTDESALLQSMQKQIEWNEGANGWRMPVDRSAIDQLLNAIVVFEITDLRFEAKFKLSQKHDLTNKQNVIAKLEKGSEEQQKVAEWMKRLSL